MHELGAESNSLHKEVGEFAVSAEIDNLIAIGETAFLTGVSAERTFVSSLSNWKEAIKFFDDIEPGDVILIKGSRAEALDFLARAAMEFLKARELGTELNATDDEEGEKK
jgi:UDP-N-acetylmuramyl pentapeptide synthase